MDESVQDGPIVPMMFVFYRGDWQLRKRSLRVAPSFSDSFVESPSVQGCREKAESSCFGHQVVMLTGLLPKAKAPNRD
jgi:hypothetical protein